MAQPYIGEIKMFAGNFAPADWQFCDGTILQISQNSTLFLLIGTTYGGDGVTTFAVPDLRGRVPLHQGNGVTLAETGGVEQVTLLVTQIPGHSHSPAAQSSVATAASPSGGVWAASSQARYSPGSPTATMHASAVAPNGGNQPHDNLVPYLCVNFIISLFGIYPSPT